MGDSWGRNLFDPIILESDPGMSIISSYGDKVTDFVFSEVSEQEVQGKVRKIISNKFKAL